MKIEYVAVWLLGIWRHPKHKRILAFLVFIVACAGLVWWLIPGKYQNCVNSMRTLLDEQEPHMRSYSRIVQSSPAEDGTADMNREELDKHFEKMRLGPMAYLPLIFDVNQYFTILNSLRMEEDWVLDYVYFTNTTFASPLLYARPKTAPRLKSVTDLKNMIGDLQGIESANKRYFLHIKTDGSPESFFQLGVLHLMGEQFYLWWHANYNDERILCDRSSVFKVLTGPNDTFPLWACARGIFVRWNPRIVFQDDKVSVQLLVFSDWSGFSRVTTIMKREFPHKILEVKSDVLVSYSCEIRF